MDEIGIELTESRTLRSRHAGRVDVLDKIGELILLPDGAHATVEMVADYYEVGTETVKQVVKRNREELEGNGLQTLRGQELREWKGRYKPYLPSGIVSSSQLTLLPREAILNVGQLLTGSSVAAGVRKYLITVEALATVEHKKAAHGLMRLQERQDFKIVLHSLKLGGAQSGDDYRLIQNTLYLGLFGKTAAQIRATQDQQNGTKRKDGKGFVKSKVAKDHLTEEQLTLLNNAVLLCVGQLNIRHPKGATVAQMLAVVNNSIALATGQRQIGGAA